MFPPTVPFLLSSAPAAIASDLRNVLQRVRKKFCGAGEMAGGGPMQQLKQMLERSHDSGKRRNPRDGFPV